MTAAPLRHDDGGPPALDTAPFRLPRAEKLRPITSREAWRQAVATPRRGTSEGPSAAAAPNTDADVRVSVLLWVADDHSTSASDRLAAALRGDAIRVVGSVGGGGALLSVQDKDGGSSTCRGGPASSSVSGGDDFLFVAADECPTFHDPLDKLFRMGGGTTQQSPRRRGDASSRTSTARDESTSASARTFTVARIGAAARSPSIAGYLKSVFPFVVTAPVAFDEHESLTLRRWGSHLHMYLDEDVELLAQTMFIGFEAAVQLTRHRDYVSFYESTRNCPTLFGWFVDPSSGALTSTLLPRRHASIETATPSQGSFLAAWTRACEDTAVDVVTRELVPTAFRPWQAVLLFFNVLLQMWRNRRLSTVCEACPCGVPLFQVAVSRLHRHYDALAEKKLCPFGRPSSSQALHGANGAPGSAPPSGPTRKGAAIAVDPSGLASECTLLELPRHSVVGIDTAARIVDKLTNVLMQWTVRLAPPMSREASVSSHRSSRHVEPISTPHESAMIFHSLLRNPFIAIHDVFAEACTVAVQNAYVSPSTEMQSAVSGVRRHARMRFAPRGGASINSLGAMENEKCWDVTTAGASERLADDYATVTSCVQYQERHHDRGASGAIDVGVSDLGAATVSLACVALQRYVTTWARTICHSRSHGGANSAAMDRPGDVDPLSWSASTSRSARVLCSKQDCGALCALCELLLPNNKALGPASLTLDGFFVAFDAKAMHALQGDALGPPRLPAHVGSVALYVLFSDGSSARVVSIDEILCEWRAAVFPLACDRTVVLPYKCASAADSGAANQGLAAPTTKQRHAPGSSPGTDAIPAQRLSRKEFELLLNGKDYHASGRILFPPTSTLKQRGQAATTPESDDGEILCFPRPASLRRRSSPFHASSTHLHEQQHRPTYAIRAPPDERQIADWISRSLSDRRDGLNTIRSPSSCGIAGRSESGSSSGSDGDDGRDPLDDDAFDPVSSTRELATGTISLLSARDEARVVQLLEHHPLRRDIVGCGLRGVGVAPLNPRRPHGAVDRMKFIALRVCNSQCFFDFEAAFRDEQSEYEMQPRWVEAPSPWPLPIAATVDENRLGLDQLLGMLNHYARMVAARAIPTSFSRRASSYRADAPVDVDAMWRDPSRRVYLHRDDAAAVRHVLRCHPQFFQRFDGCGGCKAVFVAVFESSMPPPSRTPPASSAPLVGVKRPRGASGSVAQSNEPSSDGELTSIHSTDSRTIIAGVLERAADIPGSFFGIEFACGRRVAVALDECFDMASSVDALELAMLRRPTLLHRVTSVTDGLLREHEKPSTIVPSSAEPARLFVSLPRPGDELDADEPAPLPALLDDDEYEQRLEEASAAAAPVAQPPLPPLALPTFAVAAKPTFEAKRFIGRSVAQLRHGVDGDDDEYDV